MTRAEKKEELIGLFAVGAIYLGDLIDECFEFGQQHPRWISVEDELPKENGTYLFYHTITGVQSSYYYNDLTLDKAVTHWMPLPAIEGIKGNQRKISPNEKGDNE